MAEWIVFFRLRILLFFGRLNRDSWPFLISTGLTILVWFVIAIVMFGLARTLPPSVRPLVDQVLAITAIVAPLLWGLLSGFTRDGNQTGSLLDLVKQGPWVKLTISLGLPSIISTLVIFPYFLGSLIDLHSTFSVKLISMVAIMSVEIGLTSLGFATAWMIRSFSHHALIRLVLIVTSLWTIWHSSTTTLPSIFILSFSLGLVHQLVAMIIIGLGVTGMSVTIIEGVENSVLATRQSNKQIKYWSVLTSGRALASSFSWFDSLFVTTLLNLIRNNSLHRQLILPFAFLIFGLPILNTLSPLNSTTALIASSLSFILVCAVISQNSGRGWWATMQLFRQSPAFRLSSWSAVYLASLSAVLILGIIFVGYIAGFSLTLDLSAKALLLLLLIASHSLYFYFGSVEAARNFSINARKLISVLAVALVLALVSVMTAFYGGVSLTLVLGVSFVWLIAYTLVLRWLLPIHFEAT